MRLCNITAIAGLLWMMLAVQLTSAQQGSRFGGSPKHIMFVSHLGRSHMMPYLEVLQPLADRGHKVTIVTDKDAAAWMQPNYPSYHVSFVPADVHQNMKRLVHSEAMARMIDPKQAHKSFVHILEDYTIPNYRAMADYLRQAFTVDGPVDLVLCDFMMDACADVADTLGVKFGVTLSSLPPGVNDAPYVSSWGSPYLYSTTEHLTLWQRFQDTFVRPAVIVTAMLKPVAALNKIKADAGIVAPTGPPAVRYRHALKVINTFIGFESARPVDPTVQFIGPIRSHANSTTPPAIQNWLNNLANDAGDSSSSSRTPHVIYVAFGTHVDLPDAVLSSLMSALLATLNAGYADGVIWAVSNIKRDKFPAAADLDPRLLLLPFAPQKALLAHPYVALFVSHGGAESSHEAMFAGKPMLVVPFFGDQPMNAAKLREQGMAEAIPHYQVTTTRVQALLERMLNPSNPAAETYRQAARRMQALVLAHDRTNTAAAANMMEYFAEHGWDHLITADTKMPWYKATNADLYAFVAGLAALCVCVVGLAVWSLAVLAARLVRYFIPSRPHAASGVHIDHKRRHRLANAKTSEVDAVRDVLNDDLLGAGSCGGGSLMKAGSSLSISRASSSSAGRPATPDTHPVYDIKAKAA